MDEALLMPESKKQKERFMRLSEVMKDTGLRRSSIYQKMAERTFPNQVALGQKAVAWRERDVQSWINHKIEQSQTKRGR